MWSTYSSFYGRRPIYLWGMPLMAIGSIGTALSADHLHLLFWRFVQAFGCSGCTSISAAVIGDIYRLEKRGTALVNFFGLSSFMLFRCVMPSYCNVYFSGFHVRVCRGTLQIRGAAAEYWTWRGFQMALCCGALSRWLSYTFSFPKPPIRTHVGLKMDSGREVQKEYEAILY